MAINDLIQLRKGSASEWTSINPILASGEPGYDLTNKTFKVGDGVSSWNSLSSINLTSSNITDFNTSVSGLLPVKNIIAGSGVSITSTSGNYTINSTASGGGSGSVDVYEYQTTANFPASGTSSVIYVATDSSKNYRWTGSTYVETGPVGGDLLLWNYFKPPAPTGVSATAGDAQATISWSAPTVLSQIPITDYVIQYSSNSGSTWTTFSDSISTTTTTTATGLSNGTNYIFRVAGVNGVGQGDYSSASSTVTPVAGDTLFNKVSLLLHMDGSGSTFTDSSKYGHAITTVGNTTQSTGQSKFGGKSALFAAGGDYLTIPDSAGLEFGASSFVLELWIRTTSSTQYATLIGRTPNSFSTGMWSLMINHNSSTAGDVALYVNEVSPSTPTLLSTDVNIRDGEWHHLAISRSGSAWSMYVDGVRVATATSSATVADIAGNIRIAADEYYGRQFVGYIDELRVTKGSDRGYTGTTITVPTTQFAEAIPNTDPWFENVSLLLHADGNLNDSSTYAHTLTATGNAAATGSAKFGSNALTFDGNGDWLMAPSNSAFNFPGDFTIEFWVLFTGNALPFVGAYGAAIVVTYAYSAYETNVGWQVRINGQTYTSINVFTGQTDINFNGSAISQNVWHHVAVTRKDSTLRAYVDGSLYGTPVSNSDPFVSDSARDLYIGSIATQDPDGYRFYLLGRLDELRITKGFARYTGSTYTVPTAAFPNN